MTNINQAQIDAANPDISVWVSASAGTGKTKVLTDRVLRLLLSGIPPEKILCLTFTNAAASEMKNRIIQSLLAWKSKPEEIEKILEKKPNDQQKQTASNLFTRLILSPEQLGIYTIHSFCQKILQKFPLEANIQPGFKVLGEMEMQELCEKVINDIANESGKLGRSQESFKYIIRNVHQLSFAELVREIISNQINFRDLYDNHHNAINYLSFLRREAGINEDSISYINMLYAKLQPLENIPEDLIYKEKELIELYNNSLSKKGLSNFHNLIDLFFTQKNEPRRRLFYKKSRDKYPDLVNKLLEIQILIARYYENIRKAWMIEGTIHIYNVSEYIISKYDAYKKSQVSLDYDDLIYYAKKLLSDSDLRDWVLYKLDGGISHLLVDEAQDTSPKQWQIIEAMMQEFYSGESRAKRSIFIVGDEKQSIYSFQGADVSAYSKVNQYIKEQMHNARKDYRNIELEWVYRSSSAILDLVKEIFKDNYLKNSNFKCYRDNDIGQVELWPLYGEESSKQDLFWPFVEDMGNKAESSKNLANRIANHIEAQLNSGTIMPSTGKKVTAGDFMILIRRRDQFTEELISELKERAIPVSGIDRMLIMNHISAQDVISAAKFALLPEDDLNLASLLKSPIIRMKDKEINNLSYKREGFLYEEIKDTKIKEVLEYLVNLATNSSAFDFLHHLIDILSTRKLLLETNGADSDDVLDELLNICLSWSKIGGTSLQAFVNWLEKREVEIKRDISSGDHVRIMTIHASKGLESPIVILADTTTMPRMQNHFLWKDGNFLWRGNAKNSNELYLDYRNQIESKDYQEYLRLLYVAITRTEDHLIVTGLKNKDNDRNWYNLISNAMKNLNTKEDNGILYYPSIHTESSNIFTPTCHPELDSESSNKTGQPLSDTPTEPPIKYRMKQEEARLSIPNKTKVGEEPKPNYVRSPLDLRMDISYGIVLHKILEDSVKSRQFSLDKKHPFLSMLPERLQNHILKKLPKLFQMKEFLEILEYPIIKTEASMGYKDGNAFKFGRIDLLAMSDKDAIIVDYKTDNNPPERLEDVPEKYVEQLKFYADFVKKSKPGLKVSAKILWLENFTFSSLPE